MITLYMLSYVVDLCIYGWRNSGTSKLSYYSMIRACACGCLFVSLSLCECVINSGFVCLARYDYIIYISREKRCRAA